MDPSYTTWNTSKNVPDYAIRHLEGHFDELKSALENANPSYVHNCVAFKPNQHIEGSRDFREVSILTVLQILCCMDIDNYDEDKHPTEAYRNKTKIAEAFVNRQATYRKMYPIIDDILRVYDEMRRRLPDAYNSSGKRWGRVIKQPIDNPKEELW